MKIFMMISLLSLSIFSFADEDMDKAKGNFETRKAKRLERIEKNLSELNTLKACIKKASSHEQIQGCQKELKEKFKHKKQMRKEVKKERKAKRKEKKSE